MSSTIKIDWEAVAVKLQKGVSGRTVAEAIGVHENTLYQRCKTDLGVDFVAFKAKNRSLGDELLHEAQYDLAVNEKDRGMLIWLGKQRLEQKDKQEFEHSGEMATTATVVFKNAKSIDDLL